MSSSDSTPPASTRSEKAPKTLGPYEILAPLGSGGMGDVYRASDTRLGREVAIKILRSDVAGNADRRARFEREARTVAALSHPNIVALYEVGNQDGVEYTVSELVGGETLRSVIVRDSPMPVRRVVELATQMADGMAAAHAAGIVHRDLKPENVMLTRDGRIKILDFGLARVQAPATFDGISDSGSGAEMMTGAAPTQYMTNAGVVLGTAAYMSPEQAKGMEADYRSDQFSFGLIVYEMLSGKRAFARDSAVETMAAIVRDEPEPLEVKIPVPLKWIVDRCLEKDPLRRYDSTRDLYQQLRILRDHFSEVTSGVLGSGVGLEKGIAAPVRRGISWVAAIAGLALALAVGAGVAWLAKPARRHLDRYKFTPFAVEAFTGVWSPDGTLVAYSAKVGDGYELFLRDAQASSVRQITHKTGVNFVLGWTADSTHILFIHRGPEDYSKSTIDVISRLGGTETALLVSTDLWGYALALSPDGKTLVRFSGAGSTSGYQLTISDPIGSPWRDYGPLPLPVKGVFNAPNLSFSKDGKRMLLAYDGQDNVDYVWMLPFPAASGKAVREFQNVPHGNGTPLFEWMPDGKHVVVSASMQASDPMHLYMLKLGSEAIEQITVGTGAEMIPRVSPDGRSMLYLDAQTDLDIVSISLGSGQVTPIISTARDESQPQYAATGGRMVYVTDRDGPAEIWVREPDGGARPLVTPKDIPDGVKWFMAPALSPDGSRVIFSVTPPTTGFPRLWMTSLGGGAPIRLTNSSDDTAEYPGDWSPDGSKFVFRTYRNGQPGLAVVSTDGVAQAQQLGTMGTEAITALPSWSPQGDKIAYRDSGGYFFMDPDGGHKRMFMKLTGRDFIPNLAFSKDGKTLYGISNFTGKISLTAIDAETGAVKVLRELPHTQAPMTKLVPTMRYSLSPDGQSLLYATGQSRSTLWLFQGWNE